MKSFLTLCFVLMFSPNIYGYYFHTAKQWAFRIFYDHRKTFYCHCDYSTRGKVNVKKCGFSSPYNSERADWIEWEHVVPVSLFGKTFKAWKGHSVCKRSNGKMYKGRQCLRKVSEKFKEMEGDLYNLVPVIGELNNVRSNNKMGLVAGEKRQFGDCDFEVSKGVVEPKRDIRGDVARTYFYMNYRFPGFNIVGPKDQEMFELWNNDDPVDEWERNRAWEIYEIQGNSNPFILGFED